MAWTKRDQSILIAPIAGGEVTMVSTYAYEYVQSGQAVVQIGDINHFHIEATDLTETDIARIAEGHSATVVFDALPGIKVPGTAVAILQPERGLSAFVVIVEVESLPEGIRLGMTDYITISL